MRIVVCLNLLRVTGRPQCGHRLAPTSLWCRQRHVHSSRVSFITLPESISRTAIRVGISASRVRGSLHRTSSDSMDFPMDLLRRDPFRLSRAIGMNLLITWRGGEGCWAEYVHHHLRLNQVGDSHRVHGMVVGESQCGMIHHRCLGFWVLS